MIVSIVGKDKGPQSHCIADCQHRVSLVNGSLMITEIVGIHEVLLRNGDNHRKFVLIGETIRTSRVLSALV